MTNPSYINDVVRVYDGKVKEEGMLLVDLPVIASPYELDISKAISVTILPFANNCLVTLAPDVTEGNSKLTTKLNVIKILAGVAISIPVEDKVNKLYICAETGGPYTKDLQVIVISGK